MDSKNQVINEVSLAGDWKFMPENGEWTTIQVPGGGWLKQGFDCEAGTYQREITIPDSDPDCSIFLELGAVNHLAQVWIGATEDQLELIYEEVTAFTNQKVDLSRHVKPGQTYILRIFVRAFQDGRPIAPHWAEWCESIARGIFRDAFIRMYPGIYIEEVHIQTSVKDLNLSFDFWVRNNTGKAQTITIKPGITSWNGANWAYPQVPETQIQAKPNTSTKVSVGPIRWAAGKDSFWWPNLPYQEGYQAQLHNLVLSYRNESDSSLYKVETRFGFREICQEGPFYELNGVRINFRGDNLQVANYDRIDFGGRSDAIDTFPGFLPPSPENPGWPKAVDNFLRLNYTVQRQHMGPWTPYMIDVCDEMGLMLIAESATRWNGFDMENDRGFHEVKCLEDIVRRDRNHASIIRWSTKNEAQCLDPAYHVELYDAVKALDQTRPISEDIVWTDPSHFNVNQVFSGLLNKPDFTWIDHYISYNDDRKPYFTTIQLNDAVVPMKDRPFGIGEANWMRSTTPAGLPWFAITTVLARLQGASDIRPYVLLSCWASSIPGVNTGDFTTEENRHPVYGEDNLPEPWKNPGIQLLQTACHPLLAVDGDFWWLNRDTNPFGAFPIYTPEYDAKTEFTRKITVFNDEMAGEDLQLVWELREGSPANWVYSQGEIPLQIPLGYSQTVDIPVRAPKFNTYVFLKLKVIKDGEVRFIDESTCYRVINGVDFTSEFNGAERLFK